MGRYNLAAPRVHRSVTALLDAKVLSTPPPWYETIGSIPPAQILTRPQPVQHRELPRRLQNKKPSRMFKPQQIVYEEDKIRQHFFQDHPWELARPRVILEQDGKDGQKVDWSRIEQPGRELNGERYGTDARFMWTVLTGLQRCSTAAMVIEKREVVFSGSIR